MYSSVAIELVAPAEFSALLLPGSKVSFAQGTFGKILLQDIHVKGLTILYNIYQVREDLALDFRSYPGMLQTHVALKNDSHYDIKGIGDFYLEEGRFNILDASHFEGTHFLKSNREYRSFHAICSPEMLDRLLTIFPALEEWFASDSSRPRLLFKINPSLTAELKEIIDSIIYCTYTNDLRRFFLELKIRQFLFLSMSPVGQEIIPVVGLSRRNIELIYESKRLLEKSFDQHTTIATIAKRTEMSEFKLKFGFKKIFGISLSDYLIQSKMEAAKKLLIETNSSLKEIASLTGYASIQSFLRAFKKYFHNTPGSFRKN